MASNKKIRTVEEAKKDKKAKVINYEARKFVKATKEGVAKGGLTEGKTYELHPVQAEKLIKKGFAEAVSAPAASEDGLD